MDGSKRARDLLDECYRTMQMFWNSYTMRAPISMDEHGLFSYDLKLMATNPAGGEIAWRMCLGDLDAKFGRNVDAVAARVRRELHGPFTA